MGLTEDLKRLKLFFVIQNLHGSTSKLIHKKILLWIQFVCWFVTIIQRMNSFSQIDVQQEYNKINIDNNLTMDTYI